MRKKVCIFILSFLFSAFCVIGNSFLITSSFLFISKHVVLNMFIFVCLSCVFYYLLKFLFESLDHGKVNIIKKSKIKDNKFLKAFDEHPFVFSMLFLTFAWLIYIAAFYPLILSKDPSFQIKQFFNIPNKYSSYVVLIDKNMIITNHHPVIHTLLLGSCLKLGHTIGNDNFGLFIYSIIQILILSGTLSYTISFVKNLGINKKIRLFMLLLYAFVPAFPAYAMSPVKDVIFGCFVIFYIIFIYKFIKLKEVNLKNTILMFIIMMFMILFRNNGIYVIILSFPFIILANFKDFKFLLPLFILIIGFNLTYNKVILPHFKITNTSIREALSIPFQQTARYVKEYPNEVTKNDAKSIDKILNYKTLAQRYNPELSDPVKNEYNKYATNKDLKNYFKTWYKQGLKHPFTYVSATINNTYGYVYPAKTNWYVYTTVHNQQKLINDDGFNYHYNHLKCLRKIIFYFDLIFPYIPILGLLVNIGFNVWLLFFMILYFIYKKKRKELIYLAPSFILFLVCLASPANTYFRYALPFIFGMPLMICLFLKDAINNK